MRTKPDLLGSPIDTVEKDGAMIVIPAGPRLDAEAAPEFRATLLHLVDAGRRWLVIDLQSVDFIDSSGLGALVSALKRLKQTDPAGDIHLANVGAPVLAVLEIIRLHRVFRQYESVDEAVQHFRRVT
jgi:anti-sigma B factor antagonist